MEAAALGLCQALTRSQAWTPEPDLERLRTFRDQVATLLPLCAQTLPPGHRVPVLLEAALGALEARLGLGARGERRYAQAAKTLAGHWRRTRAAFGPDNPRCLPDLEALGLLYGFAGLREVPWRAEAIRIRLAAGKGPDPALEERLVEVVEDHYGPWLTPTEREPLLEASAQLTQLWLRYRSDAALTRRVLDLGLKTEAPRVWSLVARQAPEPLRQDLASLIGRLQVTPAALAEGQGDALVPWAQALMDTPLERPARGFLLRLERALKAEADPRHLPLRRAVARVLGEVPAQVALLKEELALAEPPSSLPTLLRTAEPLLREHLDEALLDAATRKVKTLGSPLTDPELASAVEGWCRLLGDAGRDQDQATLRAFLPRSQAAPMPAGAPDPVAEAPREEPLPGAVTPGPVEAALRSRWTGLPVSGPRQPALLELINETRARLGPAHPLLAALYAELGELEGADGAPHLEQALAILEPAPLGQEQAILKIHLALLSASSLDGPRMERCQLRLLGALEALPALDAQVRELGKDLAVTLLLPLIRAERLEDLLGLLPRLQALMKRAEVPFTADLAGIQASLQRLARFQAAVRAAGLP
jgi:hypothetical protein